jgi:hypothetical protein
MVDDVRFTIVQFSGSKDGVMTGTSTIKGTWVIVPTGCDVVGFEALWNGTPTGPTGTISYDVQIGVVPTALSLVGLDQPDGTVYAGNLDADATDLEGEALGKQGGFITGVGGYKIRPQYTNVSGAGLLNVRFAFKYSAGRAS